jgi:HlyD family secretion protein
LIYHSAIGAGKFTACRREDWSESANAGPGNHYQNLPRSNGRDYDCDYDYDPAKHNLIPALDIRGALRQARGVETPPILPSQADAPKPKRKGRTKLIVFISVVVALIGGATYWALRKKDPAVTVQTEKITRHTITETVIANGKIYPVLQVHISPEVSGEIIELAVKEGQFVHKGDLLLKIKPDLYIAAINQTKANYESSLASKSTAVANLEKAEADYVRNKALFDTKLLSASDFIGFKVGLDVARANVESAAHQVDVAKANVDSAQDALDKTTIVAPLDGTITTLNSQLGERVLGTVQNAGTDIMIISDLSRMEARVDIGEMDVVLVQAGQKAKLEVDSFKDKKFAGVVTQVANSSEGLNASSGLGGGSSSSSGQSATQFQVRIRFSEGELFRPGMSVSATIETRTHTNVIAAPIASVTARTLKPTPKKETDSAKTNSVSTNAIALAVPTNTAAGSETNSAKTDKKADEKNKPVDVVFVVEGDHVKTEPVKIGIIQSIFDVWQIKGDHVKTVPVKIGISDDNYWEITDGLKEGDEIVTGGYHAISHDLDDGKKIVKGAAGTDTEKPKP